MPPVAEDVVVRTHPFHLPPRQLVPSLGDEELDQLTDLIYHPVSGLVYQRRFRFVLHQLHDAPYERVLEVGCGAGLLLANLKTGTARVVGLDLHEALPRVRRMLSAVHQTDEPLVRGNVLALPFREASFDAILCMSVLEHLRDLDRAIGELRRVLRPEGKLVLGFPAKNPVTRCLFRLVGRDDDIIHPSSHRAILDAARRQLREERLFTFPRFAPKSLLLYVVGSYRHG